MGKFTRTFKEVQDHLDQGGTVILWYNWGQNEEISFVAEEDFDDDAITGFELVGVDEDEGDTMDNIWIEEC